MRIKPKLLVLTAMAIVFAMVIYPALAFASEASEGPHAGACLIAAGLGAQDDSAGKENSSIEKAESIAANTTITAATGGIADRDWYKIILPKPGKFEIRLSGEYASTGGWYVFLHGPDGEELWGGWHPASDNLSGKTFTLLATGLSAGPYYICMQGTSGTGGKPYSLTPVFAASNAREAEPNDSIVEPNRVAPGRSVHGTMIGASDTDWFRVDLPKAGKFQIKLSGDAASSGEWFVSLFDQDGNEMWKGSHRASDNVSGKTFTLHTTGLPAGAYYVRVSGFDGVVNSQYKLTPAFAASNAWETEPNDTIVASDSVSLGKCANGTITGYTTVKSDEDWYRIALPKAGGFQIRFSGAYSRYGSWGLSLVSNSDDVLWSGSYKADSSSAKTFSTGSLKAGTYYIKVTGYSVGGLQYRLTPAYRVPKTAISGKASAKKSLTVKWKKVSGASKYQVRYSTKKSMAGAASVNVSGKRTEKKIANLKAKKAYYVQVRVAKKVGGAVFWSPWSAKKAIKTS